MEQRPHSSDRKRVMVLGAGAVGQLLGCKLSQRGHAVSFLLRPGRSLGDVVIRDLDHDISETLVQPTTVIAGDPVLVVVPPLLQDLVARVRRAGIEQPTIAMLVGFGAWPVGAELHWFRLPGAACLLSGEGDPTALAAAEALAVALAEVGLPALARPAIPAFVRALVASEYALVIGRELVGWEVDELGGDPDLCALTTAAMVEAGRVVTAEEAGTEHTLEDVPSLEHRMASINENMRAIWRVHGPKVAVQTRQLVDGLIDEAQKRNVSVDSLTALRERLP